MPKIINPTKESCDDYTIIRCYETTTDTNISIVQYNKCPLRCFVLETSNKFFYLSHRLQSLQGNERKTKQFIDDYLGFLTIKDDILNQKTIGPYEVKEKIDKIKNILQANKIYIK